ncbi:hypothetical protein DYY67_1361 [Candidatus Nitrosotalea sp. TS]|nr:hypothetical protein [Candidatus Nitrosotalea sp. TS]
MKLGINFMILIYFYKIKIIDRFFYFNKTVFGYRSFLVA